MSEVAIQVSLTSRQQKRILRIAESSRSTTADVIRAAIEFYLARYDELGASLTCIIGLGESDDNSGSVNHDAVIYDRTRLSG